MNVLSLADDALCEQVGYSSNEVQHGCILGLLKRQVHLGSTRQGSAGIVMFNGGLTARNLLLRPLVWVRRALGFASASTIMRAVLLATRCIVLTTCIVLSTVGVDTVSVWRTGVGCVVLFPK